MVLSLLSPSGSSLYTKLLDSLSITFFAEKLGGDFYEGRKSLGATPSMHSWNWTSSQVSPIRNDPFSPQLLHSRLKRNEPHLSVHPDGDAAVDVPHWRVLFLFIFLNHHHSFFCVILFNNNCKRTVSLQ